MGPTQGLLTQSMPSARTKKKQNEVVGCSEGPLAGITLGEAPNPQNRSGQCSWTPNDIPLCSNGMVRGHDAHGNPKLGTPTAVQVSLQCLRLLRSMVSIGLG